jgi:hypothetical protein
MTERQYMKGYPLDYDKVIAKGELICRSIENRRQHQRRGRNEERKDYR